MQMVTLILRPTSAYRAIEIGVPTAWLGLLAASFAIVPLLIAVPTGQATDRWGERPVLLLGSVLIVASGAVFLLPGLGALGLVIGSAVLGTGHMLCSVAQQVAVANSVGRGTFDSAFGYYTFAESLGQALGPAVIIFAGGSQAIPDTGLLFWVGTAVAGALVPCALLIRPPVRERTRVGIDAGRMRTLFRLPGLGSALLLSLVVLAAVDITLVYLPALGADRGLAAGYVGALLTMRALASMISRLFIGRLVRRTGRRRLMIGSVALSAASMAAIGFPMPAAGTAVLVVLLGLGLGVGQPLTMSWLAEAAPPALRGRAMSLRLSGNRLGQVLIPTGVGLVAAGVGAAGVLWATAGALALVGVAARKLAADGPGPAA